MQSRVKVAVVMVVVCAGAFALHEFQAPKLPAVAVPAMLAPHVSSADIAPAASAAPAAAATADADTALIYPDRAAMRALQLDYEVFTQQPDGGMMALPLPPQAAWQTQLALPAAGHKRLVLALADPQCGFDVAVDAYRADHVEPLWHAALVAGTSAPQVLDLAAVNGPDPLLLTLKMADGAQNNWSCNVAMHWDDAQ